MNGLNKVSNHKVTIGVHMVALQIITLCLRAHEGSSSVYIPPIRT